MDRRRELSQSKTAIWDEDNRIAVKITHLCIPFPTSVWLSLLSLSSHSGKASGSQEQSEKDRNAFQSEEKSGMASLRSRWKVTSYRHGCQEVEERRHFFSAKVVSREPRDDLRYKKYTPWWNLLQVIWLYPQYIFSSWPVRKHRRERFKVRSGPS